VGSSRGVPDARGDIVEEALADALRGATAAGEWTTVARLAAELQARREARAGVVVLDAARRRGKG
jgi:2C-methyl-D-erythritol 2,4-cyclodiphosphate synthase